MLTTRCVLTEIFCNDFIHDDVRFPPLLTVLIKGMAVASSPERSEHPLTACLFHSRTMVTSKMHRDVCAYCLAAILLSTHARQS